jgi:glycosyltransferase involved in cell wall biosynthesis
MTSDPRITILYISHSAELYGAEQCLLLLLSSLDKRRFSPIVVLPKDGPLKQKLDDLSIPVEIVPTMRAWLNRRGKVWRFLLIIATLPFIVLSVLRLRKLIATQQVDLVHTNSLVVVDGALAARLSKIPHVWHAREILLPATSHKFFLGHRAAISIIKRLSDRVIAVSEAIYHNFQNSGADHRLELVYDGVEVTHPPDDARHQIRQTLGIADDIPLVGEIAQIQPVKAYEDLVAAAAIVRQAIPNAAFIGIGDSSKSNFSYKQRVIDLIKEHNLQDSFKLIGFRDDILQVLSALDLLALPSHYEPFGRVLIEAMAAGKPTVGTQVGGIPDIIEDGVTGLLVPPGSPDALAKAITTILEDPIKARQMGDAGQRRVQAHFNLKSYARIEKIYEELSSRLMH